MHRTTDRFWTSFARLPTAVQRVAHENFDLLKEIQRTPRCGLRRSESCGPRGSG
jgi:hypothetical protein